MLKSESIIFNYNGGAKFSFPDIQLEAGGSLLVLGDSGIGKTTFIQILAGLLKAKSGKIELDNTNYNKLSSKEMDQFRGKYIGMIFQKPHFVRNLNILENLLLSLYLSEKKQDKKRVIQLLKEIGLGDKLESMPNELSQGEQQRVAIALAVIKKPDLILADEPTSSLDDANCQKIITLLKEQANKTKSKLIIITHDSRIKSQFNKSITL
ncbi:MAG: ATP-binding cassette domain-containing protein [Bacteroidota bacterium]|nr:ATP-binding cassette domain-containing protein [Bacteroidota bacterium]